MRFHSLLQAKAGAALMLFLSSCVADIDGGVVDSNPKDFAELAPTVFDRTCASEDVLASNMVQNPGIFLAMEEIEEHTERFSQLRALDGTTIIIPVVVHVVYRTASENISDAQIQSQIDVLNKDFRRQNSDANAVWPQATDSGIEFRLMGVSRTSTTKSSFGTNDSIKFTAQGGRNVHQPSNYLNMWVGNVGGGILGYAQFPGGAAATDGVVIDYRYFGTIGTATAPFDLGRTTTHEVGHWLNLRHIWGDSSTCGVDDFVSDTPDSNQPNYGCAAHTSCSNGGDMIQNYMDYSDDSCMNLFTTGQKTRMRALFASGGSRESLAVAALTPVDFGGGTTPPPASYQTIDTRSSLSGATNSQTTFGPYDATAFSAIKFEISGGTGDADLYVRFGASPTTTSYNCRPYLNGNTETCEFSPAQSGSYYVMIHGYTAYSGMTFKVSATGGTTTTPENCTDGADNDSDGATDCSDTDCASHTACQTAPDPEVCTDGIDNDGDGAADCNDSDCSGNAACAGAVILSSADFEAGLAPYTDGGVDARRMSSTTNCFSGSFCVELRDNTGSSASVSSAAMNLSSYDNLQIDFNFVAVSFEAGENFFVELWNGSQWVIVANYVVTTSFNNNTAYGATVPVSRSSVTFATNAKVRFRADASNDSDLLYIDDVVITAQ